MIDLQTLIADIRELAELVRQERRPSKRLTKATNVALCHAIQAERHLEEPGAVRTGLLGDTPPAPVKVSSE